MVFCFRPAIILPIKTEANEIAIIIKFIKFRICSIDDIGFGDGQMFSKINFCRFTFNTFIVTLSLKKRFEIIYLSVKETL